MEIVGLGVGPAVIAFAGGLVSFFSPCVAPLVPGYIGYLSGTLITTEGSVSSAGTVSTQRRMTPVVSATLLFVAGFSVAFILLGLLAAGFGRVLAAYQPVMQTVAGIFMLVMGAFLLGWMPQGLTRALMREGRMTVAPGSVRQLGAVAPVVLGVVFAAGWTPCVGPVLATLLAYAGASANVPTGAVLLTLYSLGFAVPFLAVGFGWSSSLKALGWAKRHGHAISVVSGAVLIVVGLLYLTGEITIFSAWAQRVTPTILR